MPDYTLKLYARHGLNTSPGVLVGRFDFEAADEALAVAYVALAYPIALENCDYAFIAGPHGRVVWEKGRRAPGP